MQKVGSWLQNFWGESLVPSNNTVKFQERRTSLADLLQHQLRALSFTLRGQAPPVPQAQSPIIRITVFRAKSQKVVEVAESATVAALSEILGREQGIAVEYFVFLFAGQHLRNRSRTLASYGVVDGSGIQVFYREFQDTQKPSVKTKDTEDVSPYLKPNFKLPHSVDPDMITQEDGKEPPRMKMPCGHTIGAASLDQFCKSEICGRNRVQSIRCPAMIDREGKLCRCDAPWPYSLVKVACGLKKEEARSYEEWLNRNWKQDAKLRNCPDEKCGEQLIRLSDVVDLNACASCPVCLAKNTSTTFCWTCGGTWRSKANSSTCGDPDCDTTGQLRKEIIEILAACDTKRIGQVDGVPQIRACPKCGQLITHWEYCKHVSCKAKKTCKTRFCFVCLKLRDPNTGWQCGSSDAVCEIHPRQTDEHLPGGKPTEPEIVPQQFRLPPALLAQIRRGH